MEYTSEKILELRKELMKCGLGYIPDKAVIELDKAIRAQQFKATPFLHNESSN